MQIIVLSSKYSIVKERVVSFFPFSSFKILVVAHRGVLRSKWPLYNGIMDQLSGLIHSITYPVTGIHYSNKRLILSMDLICTL